MSPLAVHAADVSGFVRKASDKKPLSKAEVVYKCPGGKEFYGTSNQYGRYRVSGLPNVAFCEVSVNGKALPNKINTGSGSKEVDLSI